MAILNPDIDIPNAPLALTREHHVAMGSTEGSRNPEEYRKTAAELLDDGKLRARMEEELRLVRIEHSKLNKERKSHVEMFLLLRDRFLMPNLRYLIEIGRLQGEFDIEAIETELKIPEGIE